MLSEIATSSKPGTTEQPKGQADEQAELPVVDGVPNVQDYSTEKTKQPEIDEKKYEKSSQNQQQQSSQVKPEGSVIKPFSKKNWDAIIDEFEKEEEESQGVNELFKQIYQSGNDEVRRAMNKSFQESGGTVLSTNWSNVAEKKVEPKPPSDNDGKTEYDL